MTHGRLMLLDTAALYFRAFYGVPDSVKDPDGVPVNGAKGLLDMIARLVADFEPDELVACWDDAWRPTWRVELVPSYKAQRVDAAGDGGEVVPKALTAQVPLIRETLEALGIPIVGADDHEADDVIGTLTATPDGPVDVVTGDRDLFQVVDDDREVRVVYTARGMSRLEIVTDAVLRDKYGVSAAQYADFATMRGDASDGLPGVAGVGEKTAAALLAAFGDLDGIRAAAGEAPASPMTKAVAAKIAAASDYLDHAPRVVRVVTDLDLPAFDPSIRVGHEGRAHLEELATTRGLGGSVARVLSSMDSATRRTQL